MASLILEEIKARKGLSLKKAAEYFPPPAPGRTVSASSVLRWIKHGVNDVHGRKVRLEGALVGGLWYTSERAIDTFLEAQQGTAPPADAATSPARARQRAETSAQLERLGVK